jgi:glycosyltransferase involved in cell wall biosynthesis
MLRLVARLPQHAYAPELHALRQFLLQGSDARLTLLPSDAQPLNRRDFDVLYRMMGTSPVWAPALLPEIHDYASLSTGRAARLKDRLKRYTSRQPVARSFLSEFVRESMGFTDEVPSIVRDMGVPPHFIAPAPAEVATAFDLVYVGSVTRSRGVDRMARWAASVGTSLLLVGEPESSLRGDLQKLTGVTVTGRMSQEAIPDLVRSARFAINYTPAVAPFNRQTSTKVLEYLALGARVVTNDYRWVSDFEDASGARMFRFKDLEQISLDEVEAFEYVIPDMRRYSWDSVFARSGIVEVLRALGRNPSVAPA